MSHKATHSTYGFCKNACRSENPMPLQPINPTCILSDAETECSPARMIKGEKVSPAPIREACLIKSRRVVMIVNFVVNIFRFMI